MSGLGDDMYSLVWNSNAVAVVVQYNMSLKGSIIRGIHMIAAFFPKVGAEPGVSLNCDMMVVVTGLRELLNKEPGIGSRGLRIRLQFFDCYCYYLGFCTWSHHLSDTYIKPRHGPADYYTT